MLLMGSAPLLCGTWLAASEVPQPAVQVNQAGPYVLVVGRDDMVEARPVRPGVLEGVQVVVEDGLNEGDRVIVEGIQKVRPGMAVAVTASEAQPLHPPQTARQRLSTKG